MLNLKYFGREVIKYLIFEKGVKLMNEWGKQQLPFIFFVDYACERIFISQLHEVDNQLVKFFFNGVSNERLAFNKLTEDIQLVKAPISFEDYSTAFKQVYENIHRGNSFLSNLTAETPIDLNISLLEVFFRAKAKYKLRVKDAFVCFSPEIFVRINKEGKISSFPMKGTADASLENAKELLLTDRKELWEHTTIVDLIRNDLSSVAKKVWVEKFRYLDNIRKHDGRELLQMSSEVSGLLSGDWKANIGDILRKLLPAGSITGAPKNNTIEIIKNAEKLTYKNTGGRGFYSGIMGIFDGETFDSGVMIRFIENTPSGLVFKSGGGITFASNVEKEYNELIQKIYVPF